MRNAPLVAKILLFGTNTTFLFIFSILLICHKCTRPLLYNPIKPSHKATQNALFVADILLLGTNITFLFIFSIHFQYHSKKSGHSMKVLILENFLIKKYK